MDCRVKRLYDAPNRIIVSFRASVLPKLAALMSSVVVEPTPFVKQPVSFAHELISFATSAISSQ